MGPVQKTGVSRPTDSRSDGRHSLVVTMNDRTPRFNGKVTRNSKRSPDRGGFRSTGPEWSTSGPRGRADASGSGCVRRRCGAGLRPAAMDAQAVPRTGPGTPALAGADERNGRSTVGRVGVRRPRPASAAGRRSMRGAWSVVNLANGLMPGRAHGVPACGRQGGKQQRMSRAGWKRRPWPARMKATAVGRSGAKAFAVLVPRRPRADAPSDT
jgi:hypothetical protein